MDKEIVIQFKNVSKRYRLYKDDKQRFRAIFNSKIPCKVINAIDDLSFDIHKGESVAVFGRNGAGKSTMLKMITQVTYPTEGEINVKGRVSALLELTAGFDPEFTGIENIAFRGHLLGLNDEIEKLIPFVEDFAELGDYLEQPLRTYSSGMRARLGFAINVNVDPEILIVDEALSVGDVSFRKKCLEKVRELMDKRDITFLFVTHSTSVASEFCKRGIVLKKGKLKYDGDIGSAIEYYEKMIEREDEIRRKKKQKKMLFAESAKAGATDKGVTEKKEGQPDAK